MSIKIVIERRFKEKVRPETLRTIDEIRMQALRSRGYIGGETMVNLKDNKEVSVISAWSSLEDWTSWYEKREWEALEKELLPYLVEPANIRAFMPGADFEKL